MSQQNRKKSSKINKKARATTLLDVSLDQFQSAWCLMQNVNITDISYRSFLKHCCFVLIYNLSLYNVMYNIYCSALIVSVFQSFVCITLLSKMHGSLSFIYNLRSILEWLANAKIKYVLRGIRPPLAKHAGPTVDFILVCQRL